MISVARATIVSLRLSTRRHSSAMLRGGSLGVAARQDVDAVDHRGMSGYAYACEHGCDEAVAALIQVSFSLPFLPGSNAV